MNQKRKTYSIFQKGTAVFMILTLLWLTISTPFIISFQQEVAKLEKMSESKTPLAASEEETDNPLGNTTEEKAPGGGISFSEEYLHEHHISHHFTSIVSSYNKCDNADTYLAFHGELLVPPPNYSFI